jgi:hypothetical protein
VPLGRNHTRPRCTVALGSRPRRRLGPCAQRRRQPDLLVDGEGKKYGSTTAFFRRGGATVAGGGPVTVRREGKVSSTLHGRRTAREELGRRSPWTCSRRRRRSYNDGRGARTATVGFRPDDGVIETSVVGTGEARRREAVRTAAASRSERRCRDVDVRSRQRF